MGSGFWEEGPCIITGVEGGGTLEHVSCCSASSLPKRFVALETTCVITDAMLNVMQT
jgi:hypothetical protein